MTVPHYINEHQSDIRAIKPGWYGGGEQRQALVRPVSKSREMPHWDHSGERQFSSIGGFYPMRVDSSPEITIPETSRPNIPARRVGRESRSQTFFQTNPICNARALDRLESLSSGLGLVSAR
jgi:hypothetical protein